MIFLPNKIMRYTAALRNYIHSSFQKNGFKAEHLKNLRTIYNTEAIFSFEEKTLIDIENFLSKILTAVYILKCENGKDFRYKTEVKGNCLIDLKPFTALILNLCAYTNSIEIKRISGNLTIKTNSYITKHSRIFAQRLNGCVFYETKTKNTLIVLPYFATDKKPEQKVTKSIEEYITNPFSEVNIFI